VIVSRKTNAEILLPLGRTAEIIGKINHELVVERRHASDFYRHGRCDPSKSQGVVEMTTTLDERGGSTHLTSVK